MRLRSARRAVTIVAILLMLTVFMVLATALVALGSGSLNSSYGQVQAEQALAAAEAGAWDAVQHLNVDSSWRPSSSANTTLPTSQCEFRVSVHGPGDSMPRGGTVPGGMIYVYAEGATRSGRTRAIGMMIRTGIGALDYAAITSQDITVRGGSRIDSVNPETGALLPTEPASIAVNNSAACITLTGGSHLDGSAYLGPGAASTQLDVNEGSTLTGSRSSLTSLLDTPPVSLPFPPAAAALDVGGSDVVSINEGAFGAVTIGGDGRLNLAPGTYVFQSLTLTNSGKLAITDGVEIFVAGNVDITGGSLVNPAQKPSNLKLHVGGSQVKIANGGASYAIVNAPDADIVFAGNGNLYGNLIGKTLLIDGGSALHFDPQSSSGLGGSSSRVISQQLF